MKILLIKMSSMGDIIHTLPAITDAIQAIPDLQIDWVIEPAFAEIPTWHPAITKIIPLPLRQWRHNIIHTLRSPAASVFLKTIRQTKYDIILDAQGLLKSAIVARCARGTIAGFDRYSARESLASFLYQQKYFVSKNQHAIHRTRELFSHVLGYCISNTIRYHIDAQKLKAPSITRPKKYVVFLPNTTWKTKQYPEQYWQHLLTKTQEHAITVCLPWGTLIEKNHTEKMARSFSNAVVLPKLSLSEIATVLQQAAGVVSVDTGLSHLCAALNTPTITLYGPTHADRVGTMGEHQMHLSADFPCAPCVSKICAYAKKYQTEIVPACYTSIHPDIVWHQLEKILNA